MSNKEPLLQDSFLNILRREKVPVSMYLVNGIKLQGTILAFDQYVVLLLGNDGKRSEPIMQMVYKHAVSTIVPSRTVNFPPRE